MDRKKRPFTPISIARSLAKGISHWPSRIATVGLGGALVLLGLWCMSPGQLAQPPEPSVASTDPMPNAVGVPVGSSIVVTCSSAISTSTVATATFVAHGMFGGRVNGTFTFPGGDTAIALAPARSFREGEFVRVSATAGIRASDGQPLQPYQWQFTASTVRARCFDGFAAVDTGLVGATAGSVAWGDYDQDGDLDVLLTGEMGETTEPVYVSRVYRNDGPAGADAWTFTDINAGLPGIWESSGVWGDYDNDGDLDILLTGGGSADSLIGQVYRNDGHDLFTLTASGLPGVFAGSGEWGDYDNDGRLDILLFGWDGSSNISRVYHNNGNGTFTDVGAGLIGVARGSAAWGDYDNDGDLDVLLAGEAPGSGYVSRVYRNDGDGAFSDIGAGLIGLTYSAVAWGDYDHDGDLDMLLTGETQWNYQFTLLYRNNGDGTFADIGAALPGVAHGAVSWGDYDNDGDLDILLTGLAAGSTGPISRVYRNDGNGTFTDIQAGLAGAAFSSAAWGDYDQDGDLDILLAGENITPLVRLYRNDECGELLLSKDVTPDSAAPGELITYTLAYTNDSHQVADSVLITDRIPSQMTITDYAHSGAPITPTGSVSYTWQVAALSAGSGGVITITGLLSSPLAAGVFTNTASIGGMVGSTPTVSSAAVGVRVLNVPPVANADGYTVSEDSTLVVAAPGVLANDGDANGDSLTAHPENGPASGTLALYANGGLVYTPTLDWNGIITFTYRAHDTSSAASQIARVTITVTARNDPPTVSSIPDQSTTEGEPVGPLTFTVGDVDGPLDALALSGASSYPALVPTASIAFGGSGITRTVTVTPTAGITGTARITVTVSDGTDGASTSFLLAVGQPPRLFYLPLVCQAGDFLTPTLR